MGGIQGNIVGIAPGECREIRHSQQRPQAVAVWKPAALRLYRSRRAHYHAHER
jgi:hypothetical protein